MSEQNLTLDEVISDIYKKLEGILKTTTTLQEMIEAVSEGALKSIGLMNKRINSIEERIGEK